MVQASPKCPLRGEPTPPRRVARRAQVRNAGGTQTPETGLAGWYFALTVGALPCLDGGPKTNPASTMAGGRRRRDLGGRTVARGATHRGWCCACATLAVLFLPNRYAWEGGSTASASSTCLRCMPGPGGAQGGPRSKCQCQCGAGHAGRGLRARTTSAASWKPRTTSGRCSRGRLRSRFDEALLFHAGRPKGQL